MRAIGSLLFFSLLVRIITALWSFQYRENTDVLRYKDWARIAYLYGWADAYKTDYLSFGMLGNNQPPGSLYVIVPMYFSTIQIAKAVLRFTGEQPGGNWILNGPLPNFMLRLPSILADLGLGYLIFWLVKRSRSQKAGMVASAIFLFNPVVLYNSSFWGQMDAIPTFLSFASLYFVLRAQQFLSLLLLFLSLFVKLSLAYVAPLFYVAHFLLFRNFKRIIWCTLISLGFLSALTLQVSDQPVVWLYQFMKDNAGGEISTITAFAFNFWWMIFSPLIEIGNPKTLFSFSEVRLVGAPDSGTIVAGVPLNLWAHGLFAVFAGFIVASFIQLYRKQHQKQMLSFTENLCLASALIVAIGFLFLPRMHERYLYAMFPFLAVYVGLRKKFLLEYILLAIANTLNLYVVWHPMKLPFFPYELMSSQDTQYLISVLTVGIIATLYVKGVRLIARA